DVALVKIENDEMRVVDHEGDNFFGGVDFDNLILMQLFVPYLERAYSISNLGSKMLSANGKYNRLYFKLLCKAEEAKISLSNYPSVDIEFDFTDEQGNEHEVFFTIHRESLDAVIRERIDASITFIRNLLQRNNLSSGDITEVVLVGGSTYIPLVRQLLAQDLGIRVNTSIDPTTAVVEGAAYYAGSRKVTATGGGAGSDAGAAFGAGGGQGTGVPLVEVKTAYQPNSREPEEYFAASIKNAPPGSLYRITREDGGFDSGLKPVTERVDEMLLLLPNSMNIFRLKLYNEQGLPLNVAVPDITIIQGKFSIYGQPLPNDICLEVDDTDSNTTRLEVIFERNAILPIRKTITKSLSRTIFRGSDDQLLINVLEGSRYASPQSNLPIGIVSITGRGLKADLIKGCDVDLTFEISESRDITVTAYISMIDEEFREAFSPSSRTVNTVRMKEEVDYLHRVARRQQDKLLEKELYKESAALQQAIRELEDMQRKLKAMSADDVTDTKYQLDDQKRRLALTIDSTAKDERMLAMKEEYYDKKEHYRTYLDGVNDKEQLKRFDAISSGEHEWINNCSTQFLRMKIDQMHQLTWNVRKKDLGYVTNLYLNYAMKPDDEYSNPKEIKALKLRGDEALGRQNADELLNIVYRMYDLLIDKDRDEMIQGTGLRG
ncbi:MAG TPA: Hsp70 family protein, partial [Puia sp.]|nr:Hsp70 family protein [Puia sp.]